jgi:hypothetical protein
MSLGTEVSGSVMGTFNQMGSTAINTILRLAELIARISEQRSRNFSLQSGETNIESLQRFLDNSRDGKGTVSMPRSQLDSFREHAEKRGVSYVLSESGDSKTVDITFARSRDSEAINQIFKNLAQTELNSPGGKWITDRDTKGIDPEVADRVFRKNDIEQFSFQGADGAFTVYNRDMVDSYQLSKEEARTLTAELSAIEITPVGKDFAVFADGKTAVAEINKQEAEALGYAFHKNGTNIEQNGIKFYRGEGDNVLFSFNKSFESDIMKMRGDYKAALTASREFTIDTSKAIVIENAQTGNLISHSFSDVTAVSDKLRAGNYGFRDNSEPTLKNDFFEYCMAERINDSLFESNQTNMLTFSFDNIRRGVYYEPFAPVNLLENARLAEKLRTAQNLTEGAVGDGFLVYDKMRNAYALAAANHLRETLTGVLGCDSFKARMLAEKTEHEAQRIPQLQTLTDTRNPLLRQCQYHADENSMLIVNNLNDKVMWINFNENTSRADIERGITEKLGLNDHTAAELLSRFDNINADKGILPIPKPTAFEIDSRFIVQDTSKKYVTINDRTTPDIPPLYIPKVEITPEKLAPRLKLDVHKDKSLLAVIAKAANPPAPDSKAFKSFAQHLVTAQKLIDKERQKLERQILRENLKAERVLSGERA